MEEKELYCLGIHFKAIYEQGINESEFDLAEPCRICKYGTDCDVTKAWENMLLQLKDELGIHVDRFINTHRDSFLDKCSD